MKVDNFFAELKRRNVFRAAAFYAASAWLLVQIATQVFPFFHIAEWVVRWIVVAAAIGFPFAMLFSWFYEWTPHGIQRESEIPPNESITLQRGKKLDRWIIAILALAVVLLLTNQFVLRKDAEIAPAAAVPGKSIAVLPFENLSEDKSNAFFADGVQDEILTDLSKVADLKVISRTSVMAYKNTARNLREIGQQLGVAHVLEGSMQRAGGKVRVNAQLIDARTDAHIWGEHYDRPLDDIFAIQSEIARAIADQLQAKLSPNERKAIEQPPTRDLAAFDLYLRAKDTKYHSGDPHFARETLFEAERLLKEATARDPQFLLAYCLLEWTHGRLYSSNVDHTPERLKLAEAASQNALRIDPEAGETHAALADYYFRQRDFRRARNELEIARSKLPNNAEVFFQLAQVDRTEGHWPEAVQNCERALELDPRNVFFLASTAAFYAWQRRYADELRLYERILAILPNDPLALGFRAYVPLRQRADFKPYADLVNRIAVENPKALPAVEDINFALCQRDLAIAKRALSEIPADGISYVDGHYLLAWFEALVARSFGDTANAQKAFTAARIEVEKSDKTQPDYYGTQTVLGQIDAALGRKEEAIREGRRACELLPISKDAFVGPLLVENLAVIYSWVGEKKLALEQLRIAVSVPGLVDYGQLELHPKWDSLRGDPRFDNIVGSLAPKAGPKQ
jgi:TolB-like protein